MSCLFFSLVVHFGHPAALGRSGRTESLSSASERIIPIGKRGHRFIIVDRISVGVGRYNFVVDGGGSCEV
jgi:hypothetical protein